MHEFIESSIWAIDSRYFNLHRAHIEKMIESGSVDVKLAEKIKAERPVMSFAIVGAGPTVIHAAAEILAARSGGNAPAGDRIAIIPISGPMSKNGGMCSYGTRDIGAWLKQAYADPDVTAIVLQADTPGGAVDGTEELAAVIKSANKPIVGFIDGLCASAGIWAMSQTSEIFISSETGAFAGSIGTLIQHVDQSAALDRNGIKVTFITADKSTHKVLGNGTEPLSEEALAMFKHQLNAINDTFEAAVRAGRGDKLSAKEDVFSAKIYNGRDAKKYGLVDAFGNLDAAVRRAAQLARQSNSNSINSNSENMKFSLANMPFLTKALTALNLIPSASAELTEEETVSHTEAAIKSANDAQAAAEAQLATVLEEKANLEASLATASATIAEASATIEAQADQIETLEAWKKEQSTPDAKSEDELNKNPEDGAALTPWEVATAKYKKELQA